MDNVHKHNCINVPLSQTFRSYVLHSFLSQKIGVLIYNKNNDSGLNFSASCDLLIHSVLTQAPLNSSSITSRTPCDKFDATCRINEASRLHIMAPEMRVACDSSYCTSNGTMRHLRRAVI
jgi:hypothetical protein